MLNTPGDQATVSVFFFKSGALVLSRSGDGREASPHFGKAVFARGCSGRAARGRNGGQCLFPGHSTPVTALTHRPRTAPAPGSSRARAGAGRAVPPAPHLGGARLGALPSPPPVPRTPPELRLQAGGARWGTAGAPRSPAYRARRLSSPRCSSPRCFLPPPGHLEWFGPQPGPASEGPRPPFCAAAGGVRWRRCRGVFGTSLPSLAGKRGVGPGGARRWSAQLGCPRCWGGWSRIRSSQARAGSAGGGAVGACAPDSAAGAWRPWEFPPCSGTSRSWYLRSSRTGRGVRQGRRL